MKVLGIFGCCMLAFAAGAWLGSGKSANPNWIPGTVPPKDTPDKSSSADLHDYQSMAPGDRRLGRLLAAAKEPGVLRQRHEIYEALRDFPLADLPGLIERSEKLPWLFRARLLPALVERWLEMDIAGARTWILAHSTADP